jgi:hypothetical protein
MPPPATSTGFEFAATLSSVLSVRGSDYAGAGAIASKPGREPGHNAAPDLEEFLMSMKKSDLARRLESKLEGRMKDQGVPQRFGAAAGVPDRREQRRLDAAAGLVPFACKLPSDLAAALRERAGTHEAGLNGLVAELLRSGLAQRG